MQGRIQGVGAQAACTPFFFAPPSYSVEPNLVKVDVGNSRCYHFYILQFQPEVQCMLHVPIMSISLLDSFEIISIFAVYVHNINVTKHFHFLN